MRFFAGVSLLVAVGCSPPPLVTTCQATGSPNTGGIETFQIAGDVLTVTLRIAQYCPTSIGVRAIVSVQDPKNLALPLAEGTETRDVTDRNQSNGMSTTVKVQSSLPGSYHFTARFEPNLGVVQTDILVAENHRDAGASFSAKSTEGLGACNHIAVTPGGRLMCLRNDISAYAPDGTREQRLVMAGNAAMAGPVVWTYAANRVQRWVETDAGFVPEPSDVDGGAPLVLFQPFLLPTERDLVTVSGLNNSWNLVSQSDAGGLVVKGLPAAGSNTLAAWRSNDDLLSLGGIEECTWSLGDGGTPKCGFFTSSFNAVQPFASEPVGIWGSVQSFDNFGTQIQIVTLFKPGTSHDLTLPSSWSAPDGGFAVEWDTGVALSGPNNDLLLLTEKKGSFALQKYPDGRKLLSVTSAWASFLETSTNRVFIYRR